MENKSQNSTVILWSARVLSLCFAAFISVFALDIFEENKSFWETALGLLIHLTPTYLVLLILIIAWNKPWIGAVVYTFLGLLYIVVAWGDFDWTAYVFISGPLFLMGILYFISWKQLKQQRISKE